MQKLPTKALSNTNQTQHPQPSNLNLKAIIESQKLSGKIRKPSGNRIQIPSQHSNITQQLTETQQSVQLQKQMKQPSANNRKSNTIKQQMGNTNGLSQIQTEPGASFVKSKNSTGNGKLSTIGNHRDNIAAHSEIFHFHDYYKGDDLYKKKHIDLEEALKVEEYTSSQSPKQCHNEYNMMGTGIVIQNQNEDGNDDDYHEIDQEVKIPAFLNRGSLDPKEKNQFYMTQIFNNQNHQTRQLGNINMNNSYVNTKNGNSLVSSNLKLPRSKLKQNTAKKPTNINKSQIIKNNQAVKQQMSPNLKSQLADSNIGGNKFMNINDFGSYGGTTDHTQKRQNLNTSALLTSSKDILNATAPINMNQITKMYQDEAIMQGFSDTVNSTQNLKRMNSKDTYNDHHHQNLSSYYSGVLGSKTNIKNTGGIQSKQSASPMKNAKKQMLIQTLLSQEKPKQNQNNKYFLNLTLQQLIQQQHQDNRVQNKFHNYQRKISNANDEINIQNQQKRLNKTLDNFKEQQQQYINNYQNNQDGQQFKRKPHQNININKASKTNNSNSKNKFSSTMRISDFNQTQIFDVKLNTQNLQDGGRKSKNSLKSTQNLVFNGEDGGNGALRKTSAMSTYSMNTAQTTTTHLMKQSNKNIKHINQFETGQQQQHQQQQQNMKQQKHKRQGSQEKELIKKILNFYQDDFLQQFGVNQGTANIPNAHTDAKNKTYQTSKITSAIGKMQQTKHKPNSTLNQYLNNKMGAYNDLIFNTNQQTDIQQQIQNHPYTQNRQKKCNSTYMKKDHIKELQNKTQPIPKTLLEIAQNQAANLSTGTSIACPRATSKDGSKSNTKSNTAAVANRNSKSRTAKGQQDTLQNDDKVSIKGQTNKTQPQQKQENTIQQQEQKETQEQVQKPKIGKRKDIEIKDKAADDNPLDIYNNKNTVILDEAFSNNESDDEQSKLERYTLGKQIGQGAYAVVRIATNKKDGKKYAIKIYDKSKLTDTNRQRSVRREIKLLQKMNHSNIVKIFEAFETENHVYLVMEYVGGGSLHSYLKEKQNRRLDEEDAKRIFKQIMTALQYCHRKSIAHRDIKLENILLDEDKNVKLIDFGFSTCIPNDKKIKMFCGTPSYMAPEIVMKEEYAGPPADIWASAVLLYALMNGCFPFRGATDKELYRRIQRGSFVLHNSSITDQFVEILTKMLNVNADERPKAEEILQDQWFQIDSAQVQKQQESDSIADQKRLFKAKILGKIPVEKNKNTICLNGSQEQIKNHQQFMKNQANNFPQPNVNINTDFSDYGIQPNNTMKRLNQEAYQAYYNTSGGNYAMGTGNNISNPYYNNFFQNNFINNIQQNPNTMGFYPGFMGNQMRHSPQKNTNNLTINPNIHMNFNQAQPGQNNIGTPQVFGSPTGIHCNNGIYDLQINCEPQMQMNNRPQIICNITQVTCFSPNAAHPQNILNQPPANNIQQSDPQNQQTVNNKNAEVKQDQQKNVENLELDEEIINSITQMGYQRSHVVSQLENDTSNISNLYTKLKEEKMSQTQNRPLSLQPHRKTYYQMKGKIHNNAIFPQFVPSLPDSIKIYSDDNKNEGALNYYEQNDYTAGSPRQQQRSNGSSSLVSQ